MTKTQEIFKLTAPFDNPFQGNDIRALCVCSVGILRSPTLANVLLKKGGYNVRACGSDINLALIPISANLINWANIIFFVNHENFKDALEVFENTPEFDMIKKKAICLNIEDSHDYNHPRLIRQLEADLIIKDII